MIFWNEISNLFSFFLIAITFENYFHFSTHLKLPDLIFIILPKIIQLFGVFLVKTPQ